MDTPTKIGAAAAGFYVAEMLVLGFGVFRGDVVMLGFVLLTTVVMAPSGFYFTRHKARSYLSGDESLDQLPEDESLTHPPGDD